MVAGEMWPWTGAWVLHMLRRSAIVAALLLPLALSSIVVQATQGVAPEDRILGAGAEMRLPSSTGALAETLASIARASGSPDRIRNHGRRRSQSGKTTFGWSLRGKKISEAL
jgi:hypothetical protein